MTEVRPEARRGTGVGPRLPSLLRLLIATQFAFNIGFFAVLPFLAEHLGDAVGMAGWLVGFVLGLRTFSQQGLFVVGGALADRHGVRPVVLAGCALRVVGFAWLGYAEQTWTVVAAVLLTGFAAALFSPNGDRLLVRAEGLASTTRDRQVVAVAAAHYRGDRELVNALARDHLVDHPGSVLVAWIADASHNQSPSKEE